MYTSPLEGSTAISAGSFNSVLLKPSRPTFPHAPPVAVPSSQRNLVPICSSRALPSCEYFWAIPSPLPATQTLSSKSTKQPWVPFGMTAFLPAFGPVCTIDASPQELTTFPSGSNSITGGEAVDFSGLPPTPSGDTSPPF